MLFLGGHCFILSPPPSLSPLAFVCLSGGLVCWYVHICTCECESVSEHKSKALHIISKCLRHGKEILKCIISLFALLLCCLWRNRRGDILWDLTLSLMYYKIRNLNTYSKRQAVLNLLSLKLLVHSLMLKTCSLHIPAHMGLVSAHVFPCTLSTLNTFF